MDESTVDHVTPAERVAGPRRRLLGLVAGLPLAGVLAQLEDAATEAKRKRHGRRRSHRPGKHKRNRKGQRGGDKQDTSTFPNLTGTYLADGIGEEGSIYYVHQIGNTVWWVGMSLDKGAHGATFTNVFRGTVNPGSIVSGDWATVPLGSAAGQGTLEFQVTFVPNEPIDLERLSQTGGFPSSFWDQCDDPTCGGAGS